MKHKLKMTSFFILLSAFTSSMANAALIKISNQTNFEIKVQYGKQEDRKWQEVEAFGLGPDAEETVEIPDTAEIKFSFENISPYSDEAKEELGQEIAKGMGIAGTAAVAVCTVAPLLGPLAAIAGTAGMSAKCYFDSVYYRKCSVSVTKASGIDYEIKLKAKNKRSFYIEKRKVNHTF